MKGKELQDWLNQKTREYEKDKVECLKSMLYTTNEVIKQFLDTPTSKLTRGVLESCMKCNEKFINYTDDK